MSATSRLDTSFYGTLLLARDTPLTDWVPNPPLNHGRTVGEHLMQPKVQSKIFQEMFLARSGARPLKGLELAVFDVETTGLGKFDEVLEIAAIRFDSSGAVLDHFHSLVKPRLASIHYSARAVHGISDEDVEYAPNFDTVWPQIAAVLKGAVVFAHNGPFDVRFVNQSLVSQPEGLPLVFVDTLLAYRTYTEVPANVYKLDTLARGLWIERQGQQHRAMHDCRQTAALVLGLVGAIPNLCLAGPSYLHVGLAAQGTTGSADASGMKQIQQPNLGFRRLPLLDYDLNTTKFRYSKKNKRFFVDGSLLPEADDLAMDLEQLGLRRAKRLTATVEYLFCAPEAVPELRKRGYYGPVYEGLEASQVLVEQLQADEDKERDRYWEQLMEDQREKWERADRVCPRLRHTPLTPRQYIDKFYYKRWEES